MTVVIFKYSFRAECMTDILNLANELIRVGYVISELNVKAYDDNPMLPDRLCEISTSALRYAMMTTMMSVEDSHVMMRTLEYIGIAK